ncbi:MAG: Peptidoglycan-N-acetylmuramic acid deacetylase PdaA [Eubacteriales bacterium SKADARSKE-1]|nr:Peptidoglycan-N-acetylmuramic acid deacetylase PdaA [Eubacteriales bacterium SKADARSKE-1]
MIIVLKKKQIIVSTICTVAVIAIFVMYSIFAPQMVTTSASANTNWGLSFTEKGQSPKGNATSEFLKQCNSYYIGDTNEKKIYLTFDAGFENGYTPNILDVLKKHKIKATFFLVGNYIKTSPELVKRMVEEGHSVGNHTFNHPDMSKIADMESFKKEMCSLEDLYKKTTGKDLEKLYRPPQGKYSEENLKMANELGYKTFFWSLAYVDWFTDKQPTREYAFEKLERIHSGAIVLLHSTSKTNSEILDDLLKKWEGEGYLFGDLSAL